MKEHGRSSIATDKPKIIAGGPNLHVSDSEAKTGVSNLKRSSKNLFSPDCLSLQISEEHTLIRDFPEQQIILNNLNRESQKSLKLLDFGGHLAKKPSHSKQKSREFINVDELI